jgi:hypothetical protein
MAGFMGKGALVQDDKAGSRRLEVSISDYGQNDVAFEEAQPGTFEVFLDEALTGGETAINQDYDFIVLAATATDADGIYLSYPTTEGPGTEEEQSATYSGTTLLLVSHKEYASQQKAKFRSLLKEVFKRTPDVLIPDPPYGAGKSLGDQTAEMRQLVEILTAGEKRNRGEVDVDRWYRRVGAAQFRGLGRKRWESVIRKGRTKILLD